MYTIANFLLEFDVRGNILDTKITYGVYVDLSNGAFWFVFALFVTINVFYIVKIVFELNLQLNKLSVIAQLL